MIYEIRTTGILLVIPIQFLRSSSDVLTLQSSVHQIYHKHDPGDEHERSDTGENEEE